MKAVNNFQPAAIVQRSVVIQNADDPFIIYQDGTACTEAFKKLRIHEGINCKKCQAEEFYWLAVKEQFQCKKCRFRITLRSGTVLENSRLPISYLFIAVHLLLKSGGKLAPEKLQQVTGHKYFEPLWHLLRKIKEEMSPANQTLLLLYFIESIQIGSGNNSINYHDQSPFDTIHS